MNNSNFNQGFVPIPQNVNYQNMNNNYQNTNNKSNYTGIPDDLFADLSNNNQNRNNNNNWK